MAKYNASWLYNAAILYNSVQEDQTIYAGGLFAELFGDHGVAESTRYISDASAGDIAEPGVDHAVTHWLQHARPESITDGEIGEATLGETPRTLSPPWWYSTEFGTAFVGEYLTVSPRGMLGEAGQPTVIDLVQRVRTYAGDPGAIGAAAAALVDRDILHPGIAPPLISKPLMEPLLRELRQSNEYQPSKVGTAAVRLNTLWPLGLWAGIAADRVTVSRSGDVLNPVGLDAGAVPAPMVSHYERTVPTVGIDSMSVPVWHHARNDARLLWPSGAASGDVGRGSLVNELRTVQVRPAPPQGAIGTAWADRAVRTSRISFGIDAPLGGRPTVQNWERYLSPAGYWQVTTGGHFLFRRQNRIEQSITGPHTQWGTAGVANEDREIQAYGLDAGPRGHTRLFRSPEYYPVPSITPTVFGFAEVADSTRQVNVSFAGAGGWVPETHWLRKELPDPPVNQLVLNVTAYELGFVSTPLVRRSVVYPDGIDAALFGQPVVSINGIRPQGIPPPGYGAGGPVGVPYLPNVQTINGPSTMLFTGYGEARLSPHYIWAPVGNGGGQLIDAVHFGSTPDRPGFGTALFTHEVRTTEPLAFMQTEWGGANVVNQHRRIDMIGPRLFKSGFPNLRSGGDIEPNGIDAAGWGTAVVAPPSVVADQTVTPEGVIAGDVGSAELQNQHRTISLDGFDAAQFGEPWASYQYDPFQVSSLIATLAGEPLVEYLHRGLDLDGSGFDALDMTPYPGWSGDRMRIRQISFVAVAAGTQHTSIGTPMVEQHHRGIGVNGIERPQIQVPEGGRVRGESQLAPDGLDAGVIGDPRMWEPGDDVLPYAEDMLTLGSARLIGVVQPGGFEALLAGDIRVSQPVEPAGDERTDWGAAVVSHDGGGRICNSHYALAIAMAAMDAGTLGSHGVAHDP